MIEPTIQQRAAEMTKECLSLRIRMLNRVLTQIYDDAFRELDLKAGQFSILLITAQLETVLPRDLCDELQIDTSTLSRNLERMRTRGWLEVVAGRNGREQPFKLTEAGLKILEQAIPMWEKAQEQAKTSLGEMGVALLKDSARRVSKTK